MKAKVIGLSFAIGMAALMITAASGAPDIEPQAAQLRALMAEIHTWILVDGLNLSRGQMETLLPLAREVRAEAQAIDVERMRAVPEFEAAIRRLREEVLANNGVSEEAKAAVARAKAGWKRIEFSAAERLSDRAQTLLRILTPGQVQLALGNPGSSPARLREAHRGQAARPPIAARAAPREARYAALRWPHDVGDRLAQRLLTPALATVLEARLGIAPPGPVRSPTAFPPELETMLADVRILNLVNSLYLNPQQMRGLSQVISTAEAERQAQRPRVQELLSGALAVATRVRAQLAAGSVTPQVWASAREVRARWAALERERSVRAQRHVAQVKGILNQNQLTLVSEFIPCLIPVRSLTNPERIGQAQDTEGAERLLERARTIPEGQILILVRRAQERLRAGLLRHRTPTAEVEKRVADVPRVIAEARAMSDTEFELHKAELAARVGPPAVPAAEGRALDARIAAYLMHPNLLPIFAQRIAAAETAAL